MIKSMNSIIDTTKNFVINGTEISFNTNKFPFKVKSFPNAYDVDLIPNLDGYLSILKNSDFIIVDKNVNLFYSTDLNILNKSFIIEAVESNKNMETVINLIDEFMVKGISKGSNVVAIGGGIIQDIAACACALFRRGLPFTYMPTTTLGQLDSCVGAKCAINTTRAKNVLGLFSAPRKVLIPSFMINSMPNSDHRAGLSEMLRLCLTASQESLETYLSYLPSIIEPKKINSEIYKEALNLSLSIKKSVVEYDEYEKDVRRSMNYGHTFGHAIEKLCDFQIPHGLGVLLGMHMSNTFSLKEGIMNQVNYEYISKAIKATITGLKIDINFLREIKPSDITDQFKFDKKGDGTSVPLILIKEPGEMIFYKFNFKNNNKNIHPSISLSISEFIQWSML